MIIALISLLTFFQFSGSLADPCTTQLDAFGKDSIRIRIAPPGVPLVDPEYRTLLPHPPALDYERLSSRSSVHSAASLQNGNIMVSNTDDTNCKVVVKRVSDGKVLLQQTAFQSGSPLGISGDSTAGLNSATVTFQGTAGERVYGFGEHRNGNLNQMGFERDFRDSQYYGKSQGADVMVPYYGSSVGYGFMWNSASYGNVSVKTSAITWSHHAAKNADFWVTTTPTSFNGSSLAACLSNFVDVVGHAAPMPHYATGFWQCKNRYRNQTQLLDVAHGYVSRKLPISIIVVDYMHWAHFGDWSFNPACWPDVPGMVADLKKIGVELAVTFWPMVVPGSANFDSFNKSGYFLADSKTKVAAPIEGWAGSMFCTDELNPDARAAIFDAFWKGYGQYGVRTIWLDGSEPERSGAENFGQFLLGPEGKKMNDMEVGEIWVREHARAFQEGFAKKNVGPSDFVTLARSGWAGSSAYSSAVWSGDISSTFGELLAQIKSAQGFALSGQALWTTDIGGYGGGNPENPEFQELIVRWFQFGAFCPLFRLHGQRSGGPPSNNCGDTGGDNEVWNLAKDQQHYEGITRVMLLRETLRDYVMQINKQTVETGMPMLRAMTLEFPDDPNCALPSADDQFMFGPSWLVAPVYTYKQYSRTVYLPTLDKSEEWVHWWSTTVYPGGSHVVNAPINEFPLFFRRKVGTKIPFEMEMVSQNE